MKVRITLIFLSFLVIFSCNQDDYGFDNLNPASSLSPPVDKGEDIPAESIIATVGDVNWIYDSIRIYEVYNKLFLEGSFNGQNSNKITVQLNKNTPVGVYQAANSSVSAFFRNINAFFYPVNGTVSILQHDTSLHKVVGRFEFIGEGQIAGSLYYVSVIDGKFNVSY